MLTVDDGDVGYWNLHVAGIRNDDTQNCRRVNVR